MVLRINNSKIEHLLVLNIFISLFYAFSKEIRLLRPFRPLFNIVLVAFLIIGAVTVFYNFLYYRRNINKKKLLIVMLALCLTLAISSVINYDYLVPNVKELVITIYCLLGVFPLINRVMKKEMLREKIFTLLRILVVYIDIASFISIFLYLTFGTMKLNILGQEIFIGSLTNRMFGIFESLTIPYTTINIFLALLMKYYPGHETTKSDEIIIRLSLLLGLVFMSLAFSYGTIVAFAVAFAVYMFFLSYKKGVNVFVSLLFAMVGGYTFVVLINTLRIILLKIVTIGYFFRNDLLRILVISIFLLAILGVFYIFINFVLRNIEDTKFIKIKGIKLLNLQIYLVGFLISMILLGEVASSININVTPIGNSIEDEILEEEFELITSAKKQEFGGFLTGRDIIWKYGINQLRNKPLIGFGPRMFYGEKVLGEQELQHMHSVFVHSLVGGGIVHFATFLLMLILIATRISNYLFVGEFSKKYLFNLIISMAMVFFITNGLIETNFLYVNRFPQYACWFILGLSSINFFNEKSKKI